MFRPFRAFIKEDALRPQSRALVQELLKRPDADQLYIHGSNHWFDRFQLPKLQVIFFSKLVEPRLGSTRPLQAEYYGRNFYVCKLAAGRPFQPWRDPKAKEILADALHADKAWDIDEKVRIGRVDYQDLHAIVPPAVKAGYNRFTVYEISMQLNSHAVSDLSLITLVDRYQT